MGLTRARRALDFADLVRGERRRGTRFRNVAMHISAEEEEGRRVYLGDHVMDNECYRYAIEMNRGKDFEIDDGSGKGPHQRILFLLMLAECADSEDIENLG